MLDFNYESSNGSVFNISTWKFCNHRSDCVEDLSTSTGNKISTGKGLMWHSVPLNMRDFPTEGNNIKEQILLSNTLVSAKPAEHELSIAFSSSMRLNFSQYLDGLRTFEKHCREFAVQRQLEVKL